MNGNRDLLFLQKVIKEPIYDNQSPKCTSSIENNLLLTI